ncbi:MAG: hypothetical protein HWD61_01960 [Parachlamydiaceae bacterium]|nr:MAG: hypothetical protein HWD61_01960 [Parachlamydiaceae bacterium]
MVKNFALLIFSLIAFAAIFAFAKITLPTLTQSKIDQAKKVIMSNALLIKR